MKQWQNVVQVCRSAFQKALWNDCDEAAVNLVADGYEPKDAKDWRKHGGRRRKGLQRLGFL